MKTYIADFSLGSDVQAGAPTELTYTPRAGDGRVADELEVVHEQLSHLIVVSEDLSFFDHVHAERREDGAFALPYTFPAGGTYVLFADFVPKATGRQVVARHEVVVEGEAHAAEPLRATTGDVAAGEGLRARLQAEPEPLSEGPATLTLRVTGEGDQPAGDLEPYLGAGGHMVIISEDTQAFLHAHPFVEGAAHDGGHHAGAGAREEPTRYGPELAFHTEFPRLGHYKVWAQVKRAGEVVTFPFVVEVTG